MVGFVSSVAFGILVMALTVSRTGRIALESRRNGIKRSFSLDLFWDGMGHHFYPLHAKLLKFVKQCS